MHTFHINCPHPLQHSVVYADDNVIVNKYDNEHAYESADADDNANECENAWANEHANAGANEVVNEVAIVVANASEYSEGSADAS